MEEREMTYDEVISYNKLLKEELNNLQQELDKYKAKECNYKNAWEELKNTTIFTESYPRENKMSEYYDELFKDLEEKYGIEVE